MRKCRPREACWGTRPAADVYLLAHRNAQGKARENPGPRAPTVRQVVLGLPRRRRELRHNHATLDLSTAQYTFNSGRKYTLSCSRCLITPVDHSCMSLSLKLSSLVTPRSSRRTAASNCRNPTAHHLPSRPRHETLGLRTGRPVSRSTNSSRFQRLSSPTPAARAQDDLGSNSPWKTTPPPWRQEKIPIATDPRPDIDTTPRAHKMRRIERPVNPMTFLVDRPMHLSPLLRVLREILATVQRQLPLSLRAPLCAT